TQRPSGQSPVTAFHYRYWKVNRCRPRCICHRTRDLYAVATTTSNWPASITLETSDPQGNAGGELAEREVSVVVLRRPADVVEMRSDGEGADMEGELGCDADAEDRVPVQGAEVIDGKGLGAGERILNLVAALAARDEREFRAEAQPDMPTRFPLEQGGQAP